MFSNLHDLSSISAFLSTHAGKSPHDDDCPYRQILRAKDCPEDFTANGLPPVVQAHGYLDFPESVVFTRTGYRQLLYKFPEYTLFLKCLLASFTVLYIGALAFFVWA